MVVAEERELSSAAEARPSSFAPVCAVDPDCRNAEPAKERCRALAEPLWSVFPARDATLEEVCFVFEPMTKLL